MSRRLLNAAIAVALVAVGFVAFALPASAEQRTFRVQLANGSVITVSVNAPCEGVPALPGTLVSEVTPPEVCNPPVPEPPSTPTTPTQPTQPQQPPPSGGGNGGGGSDSRRIDARRRRLGQPVDARRPAPGSFGLATPRGPQL